MSTHLIVPMRVDALALTRPLQVIGPSADLALLPWTDGLHDRNAQTPNLASAVNAQPFADHGLRLDPGVHLHWTIPPGLTRGSSDKAGHGSVDLGEVRMPAAPNRWLVRRLDPEPAAWLVESDYVRAPRDPHARDAVAYLPLKPGDGKHPPFLRLGRTTPVPPGTTLAQLLASPDRAPGHYLPALDQALTVLGHRDPAFASFYPNCRGVFGCHDHTVSPARPAVPHQARKVPDEVAYEVFGWYGGAVEDPLQAFLAREAKMRPEQMIGLLNRDRLARHEDLLGLHAVDPKMLALALNLRVEAHFGWSTRDPWTPYSAHWRTLCHGQVRIAASAWTAPHAAQLQETDVAVGNTVGEAVTALLCREFADDHGRAGMVGLHVAAAELARPVAHQHLDFGPKLEEARHSAQFSASRGHRHWLLRPAAGNSPAADAGDRPAPALPAQLARELDTLNRLQAGYDRAHDDLRSRRQALFAAWHQWMQASYPPRATDAPVLDVNALFAVIVREHLEPLEAVATAAGDLAHVGHGARRARVGDKHSLAGQVEAQRAAIFTLLKGYNAARAPLDQLHLALGPGQRFWRPNDPVVVLAGAAARTAERHAAMPAQGAIPCRYADLDPESQSVAPWAAMAPLAAAPPPPLAEPPWNPLLLEWEVELCGMEAGANQHAGSVGFDPGGYKESFVTGNYALAAGAPDLADRPGAQRKPGGFEYLAGRTLLNPGATARIAGLLEDKGLCADLQADDIDTAVLAGAVAQPLAGFHEALLMRCAEPQLPVADPLGFERQQGIAQRVQAALHGYHPESPVPEAPFHPIRSGEMVFERLRLIDAFGQSHEWRPGRVLAPPAMRAAGGPADRVRLAPRLAQPARLHLQWLAAAHDEVALNDHPGTSPICGWLLPNTLDGAIDVHDAGGHLLGILDAEGWQPAPALPGAPRSIGDIANRHLAAGVRRIAALDDFDAFLDEVEVSLDAIEPLDGGGHQSRALLVGRPVALVRARLDLQLRDAPARDQSWQHLRQRLQAGAGAAPRGDHDFTRVKFPLRIGEHEQSNDGVVALWLPDAHGEPAHLAFPQTRADSAMLEHAIDDAPVTMTVLLDPRALMHVTCGILPVKAIGLPPALWAPALENIAATFLSAPLLMPADSIALPLPAEPGAAWGWVQQTGSGWREWPQHPVVEYAAVLAGFPGRGPALWQAACAAGVLVPDAARAGRAALVLDAAARPGADPALALGHETLQALTRIAQGIAPAGLEARFGVPTVIREGWLQLRRAFSAKT